MSMNLPPRYRARVTLLGRTAAEGADSHGEIDIFNRVSVLEYVDAAPQSLLMTLNAKGGYFMSNGPVIRHWDRIYVELSFQGRSVGDVFHVKTAKKEFTRGIGYRMTLVCLHESSNLYTQLVSKPNRRVSGVEALKDALRQLNANRGTLDPEVVGIDQRDYLRKTGIFLDPTTYNDYIFEMKKLQAAVQIIIDKEAEPESQGGSREYYFFRFKSTYNPDTHMGAGQVVPQMIPQGYVPNADATGWVRSGALVPRLIQRDIDEPPTPVIAAEFNHHSEKATNIIHTGDKHTGSYPPDYSLHVGQRDFDTLGPRRWAADESYSTGQRVRHGGITYVANAPSTGVEPVPQTPAGQTPVWALAVATATTPYSPLTSKIQYWLNSMYGYIHAGSPRGFVGILDHNCVVQNSRFPRLFVHTRATNPASIAADLLAPDGDPPHNLTCLCLGTGTGAFSDASYHNNVCRYIRDSGYNSGPGRWIVFRRIAGEAPINDYEVIVRREGETYVFNPVVTADGGLATINSDGSISGGARNTTGWVRGAYDVTDLASTETILVRFVVLGHSLAVHPVARDSDGHLRMGRTRIAGRFDATTRGSGIYAEFTPHNPPMQPVQGSTNNLVNHYAQRAGIAGFNFDMMFPVSKFNLDRQGFGGVAEVGEQMGLPAFDFDNMHQSRTGTRILLGETIRDYMPIQAFGFFEFLRDTYVGGEALADVITALTLGLVPDEEEDGITRLDGNYAMELFLVDENYNTVLVNYSHLHNNVATEQRVPIGQAVPFRGRIGRAFFTDPLEVENYIRFDWKRVMFGGITTRDSYDASGRYIHTVDVAGILGGQGLSTLLPPYNRFNLSDTIRLSIDAFRMVKPLVVSNVRRAALPERNIVDQIVDDPTEVSPAAAQATVDGYEALLAFRRQEVSVESESRFDVRFGDCAYFTNEQLIEAVGVDGMAHTIKGVAEKVVHKVVKPQDGPGGLTTTTHLVTRFYPEDLPP